MHRGTIWRAAFPLIAEGLQFAGVRVIARPRDHGKTNDLIALAQQDPKAILLCPTPEMARAAEGRYREKYPHVSQCDSPLRITTLEQLELHGAGGPPSNLYIDEGGHAFPDIAFLLRHQHVIKAVTFSC